MRWLAVVAIAAAVATGLADGRHLVDPPGKSVALASPHVATTPRRPLRPKRVHTSQRPPQFIVISFDGSGGARLWSYWRRVAREARAHFTFFVSGVYLVDWAHHDEYFPPRHARGESAIGFAPNAAWITAMRRQMVLGYREGNEIGTHYNGHFCGPGGVGDWTAADWATELDEFDRFLFRGSPRLPFGPSEIAGGRTPCLEGNLDALYPVLAQRGFLYDASQTALPGTWPSRRLGLWSIPLLDLPFTGHTFRVVSMDYNMLANQVGEPPARIEEEAYDTLWNAFRTSYLGNRAPLSFGNHFETWESWAYDHALTRFVLNACRLPEVRCTTMRTLVEWLDAQAPAELARDRAGRFPHLAARSPALAG